jgi:hypothetical protein
MNEELSMFRPDFLEFLENTLISSFSQILAADRVNLQLRLLNISSPSNLSAYTSPSIQFIQSLQALILTPAKTLPGIFHELTSCKSVLSLHLQSVCQGIEKHFPERGGSFRQEFEVLLSDRCDHSPKSAQSLDDENSSGLLEFPVGSKSIESIPALQQSLVVNPFRKMRKDLQRYLTINQKWNEAKKYCEEEVRDLFEWNLMADIKCQEIIKTPNLF